MKLYNNSDDWIVLEPGDDVAVRASKLTKDTGKLMELQVDEVLSHG